MPNSIEYISWYVLVYTKDLYTKCTYMDLHKGLDTDGVNLRINLYEFT